MCIRDSIKGTHDAMPPGRNWPHKRWLLSRRHRVEIHFGAPIWPGAEEHRNEVMSRVRSFLEAEAGLNGASAPSVRSAPVAERPVSPVV